MRQLALALLNDDHGINNEAWKVLYDILESEGENDDIFESIKMNEGRWYLPESFFEISV